MNTYYRIRHTRRPGRRTLLAVTAAVVVLFALDLLSGGVIRGQIRTIAATIFRGADVVAAPAVEGVFTTRGSLVSQNAALRSRVAALEDLVASREVLRAENEELRQLTRLAERSTKGIAARIISSVSASPYGTFLINAGREEGVVQGSLVQTAGGFVIGRVADVAANSSLVSAIFAPSASIEAVVAGAQTTLVGEGGGNAQAQVPRTLNVRAGDIAYAPSLAGRPVGMVGRVASSSASAAQSLYLRIPTNLSAVRIVYVTPL